MPDKKQYYAEIRKTQEKLLEILIYFADICREHGLRFTLAGGTCLGAVRHGGFIPWDDDVDVFMLRDDYERLQTIWQEYADLDRYTCVRSDEHINIHHAAIEIKDNNTTFINKHSVDLDIHQGLMIDVIPLDGVANGRLASLWQKIQAMLFACFNFQRLPDHKGKITYYLTKLALEVVRSPKRRYKIWRAAEKNFTKHSIDAHEKVASFTEGPAIMKQQFPKEWFQNPTELLFEGHSFPVPADTDAYLRISYGDYMELPPEEEQVRRHITEFIDLENSYTKYRGIKYLVHK